MFKEKLKELIESKVVVIPHGVDHSIFKKNPIEHDKVTFLINKGFRNLQDRGGAQYALQAYINEFTDKENVRLIFKLNPAYGIPDLKKILDDMGKGRTDLPEIVVDTANYKYEALNNLYNQADIFVSTTRAEGFNLPCIEAMACGLPIITSNFGGQTDYIEDGNQGILVGGELEEIKHELQYEGNSWLTPNIKEIQTAMRKLFNDKELRENIGNSALEKSADYSWKTTADKFVELIN